MPHYSGDNNREASRSPRSPSKSFSNDNRRKSRSPQPESDHKTDTHRGSKRARELSRERSPKRHRSRTPDHRRHHDGERRGRREDSRDRTARKRSSSPDNRKSRDSRKNGRDSAENSPRRKSPETAQTAKMEEDPLPKEVVPKKRVPLSLEEILEQQKAKKEAESKPKFSTKEERAAAALKARQDEAEQQRKRMEEERNKHADYLKMSKESSKMDSYERDRRERLCRERDSPEVEDNKGNLVDFKERDRELKAIKEKYLGKVEQKMERKSASGRKFLFDWKTSEDTSIEYNSLYSNKHEVQFFGRVQFAESDMKQRKKDQSKLNSEMLDDRTTVDHKEQEGVAATGSGKTAAFLMPLLSWIKTLPKSERYTDIDNGPYAIIIAPDVGLADRIEKEAIKFGGPLRIRIVNLCGGSSKHSQLLKLREGCDIVIAVPGRLLDALESRYLVLHRCTYVLFDKADNMINISYEEVVQSILSYLPFSNQKPDTDDAESSSGAMIKFIKC